MKNTLRISRITGFPRTKNRTKEALCTALDNPAHLKSVMADLKIPPYNQEGVIDLLYQERQLGATVCRNNTCYYFERNL